MKTINRIIFLIVNLALGLVFILPLWKIDLIAPQYPEGLQMKIWLSKLSGNLDTINNLNHYIGMKYIKPDSIAELKFMPYILGFFIILGIITVVLNKSVLLKIWFVLLAIIGIIGLGDFYSWLYDYGHNLDPRAAIKIPGMSYQPPLIGTKKLLNFTASSYPESGGIILILAGVTTFFLVLNEMKKKNLDSKIPNAGLTVMFIFVALFTSSCTVEAEPINFGTDPCAHCKMTIADNKFGGEIVTSKGKVFKFDDINCTVKYLKSFADINKDKVLFINMAKAGQFVDAKKALFLQSDKIMAPMNSKMGAFETQAEMDSVKNLYPGKTLTWSNVLEVHGK